MKRPALAYSIWFALVLALIVALAAYYRHVTDISWSELARRVVTGTTDATDAQQPPGEA